MNRKGTDKILTVVVPVYNVEQYIKQCVHSIIHGLRQSDLDRLEVIIVNDCTPDHSMKQIESIVDQYPSVFTLINHIKNTGLGGARNSGIENARGKYLVFIDSDDWYESGAVSEIIELTKNLAENDILIYGFEAKIDNKIIWSYLPEKTHNISAEQALHDFSLDRITASFCNKIFPAKLIKRFKFSEHRYYEDLEMMPLLLQEAKVIHFLNKSYLNYRLEGLSITRQKTTVKHIKDFVSVLNTLLSNVHSDRIRSNFFFNRWAYVFRVWDLDNNTVDFAIREVLNQMYKNNIVVYEKAEFNRFKDNISLKARTLRFQSIENISVRLDKICKENSDYITQMSNDPILISIILPVYNNEQEIVKLISFIEKQNQRNIEYIFVDNKSDDNSLSIIGEFANAHFNVNVIELDRNYGAGYARNAGIKRAKGNYLFFHDADDWINLNSFDIIKNLLVAYDFPDALVFSFEVFDANYKFNWINENLENIGEGVYSGQEFFKWILKGIVNPVDGIKCLREICLNQINYCFQQKFIIRI